MNPLRLEITLKSIWNAFKNSYKEAAALTYFTMFAFVPCFVIIYFESDLFGVKDKAIENITSFGNGFLNKIEISIDSVTTKGQDTVCINLNSESVCFPLKEDKRKDFIDALDVKGNVSFAQFIENYISTKLKTGGWGLIIGIIILLWSVYGIYSEIEQRYDDIWAVEPNDTVELYDNDNTWDKIKEFILDFLKTWGKGLLSVILVGIIIILVILGDKLLDEWDFFNNIVRRYIECGLGLMILLGMSYKFIPKADDNIKFVKICLVSLGCSVLIMLTTWGFVSFIDWISQDEIYGKVIGGLLVICIYVRIIWTEILFGLNGLFGWHYRDTSYITTERLNALTHTYKETVYMFVLKKLKKETKVCVDNLHRRYGMDPRVARWALNKLERARIIVSDYPASSYFRFKDDNPSISEILKNINTQIGNTDVDLKELFEDTGTKSYTEAFNINQSLEDMYVGINESLEEFGNNKTEKTDNYKDKDVSWSVWIDGIVKFIKSYFPWRIRNK